VESLTISLSLKNLQENKFINLSDEVKINCIFYFLTSKISKIHYFSERNNNKKNLDLKLNNIQQIHVKKPEDIETILLSFFLHPNFYTVLNNATYQNLFNKTVLNIEIPTSLINEALQLDEEFDLPIKEYTFKISLNFNKNVNKDIIKSLFYFG
jgi:hypothetical protein